MAFIFPISCILALIFPILIKYFPKCVGKGSFPKSQIKSLLLKDKVCRTSENCKSLVLQDQCNIETFLSPDYLMFFIAYAFKGHMHVFAGWVKIVSHSTCCRTSAILKYFCPLCVKPPPSKRPKNGFQDQLSLNAGQKYCRMLHSATLSTFIKLTFIVIKIFVLSIFEWPLKTDFTVFNFAYLDKWTTYQQVVVGNVCNCEFRYDLLT